MLRLVLENYLHFIQRKKHKAMFDRAEANEAINLSNYDADVTYVIKSPAHKIGQAVVNSLRKFGADTSMVVRGGSLLVFTTTIKRRFLREAPFTFNYLRNVSTYE